VTAQEIIAAEVTACMASSGGIRVRACHLGRRHRPAAASAGGGGRFEADRRRQGMPAIAAGRRGR
jgi:hypothetical protein